MLSIFTLISLPFGLTVIGASFFYGKSGRFKLLLIIVNAAQLLVLILVLSLLKLKLPYVSGAALLIFQVCSMGNMSVGYEFVAEMAFPVGKTVTDLS